MTSNDVDSIIGERDTIVADVRKCISSVLQVTEIIADAFERGDRLFIFGNGGSAADSQHMAAEFVGRFGQDRIGLPAIALTVDTSALTAIANDWQFSYVFRRQLEALARPGDVALGISTSGNSSNVLEALAHAQANGMASLGLVGNGGGAMRKHCSILIDVGPGRTPVIQEKQLIVEHTICELVETILRKRGRV